MISDKKFDYKKILVPVAFVFICMLILFIIFMVNRDRIFTNLKETDFFGRVFGSTPKIIENHEVKQKDRELFSLEDDIIVQNYPSDYADGTDLRYSAVPLKGHEDMTGNVVNNVDNEDILYNNNGTDFYDYGELNSRADNAASSNGAGTVNNNIGDSVYGVNSSYANDSAASSAENINKAVAATSVLDLCFVIINDDGTVIRRMVKRTVPKSDAPLTNAINLLLAGPIRENKSEYGCRSLIPNGSKLISARVADGVAYLDFNEEFEFTSYGVEGAIHQLEQVVYTATAFPTVDCVQFLIEGRRREYLGSEGQWIGTPLSRANF